MTPSIGVARADAYVWTALALLLLSSVAGTNLGHDLSVPPEGKGAGEDVSQLTPGAWGLSTTIADFENWVNSVSFNSDGLLATGGNDGKIGIWDTSEISTGNSLFVDYLVHGGGVTSLAFSPDGSLLASGSWDNTTKIWNVSRIGTENDPLITTLSASNRWVDSVAFSPDGSIFVSSEADTVYVWDTAMIIEEQEENTPIDSVSSQSWVSSVSFSHDSLLLAVATDENVKIWDTTNFGTESQITLIATLNGHEDSIEDVAFTPTDSIWGRASSILASASQDGVVNIWDTSKLGTASNPLIDTVEVGSRYSGAVSFSPDGLAMATASNDNWNSISEIRIWDTRKFGTGQDSLMDTKTGHGESVIDVAFSPDGDYLASSSYDDTVMIWEEDTDGDGVGRSWDHCSFTGLNASVDHAGCSDAQVDFDGDGLCNPWSESTGPSNCIPNDPCPISFEADCSSPEEWVQSFILDEHADEALVWHAISPDGLHLATGSYDGYLKIWDLLKLDSGQDSLVDTISLGQITSLAFSSDGNLLAAAWQSSSISGIDIIDTDRFGEGRGSVVGTISTGNYWVRSMDFNLDGRFLAVGLDSDTVEIWGVEDLTNYPNGVLLDSLTEHDGDASSVAFSPDGTYLVSSSDDEILVWNTAQIGTDEDAPVRKLNTGSAQDIWDMSFSPDSSLLASVSGDIMDGEIALWNVDLFGTASAPLITTISYAEDLTSIAFSPDGSLLASGSWNSVQVWNVSNMAMMSTFSIITNLILLDPSSTYVYTVSFSPDGNRVFAAGFDGVETWSGDSDGDGHGDPTDLCSDTLLGEEVDDDGCSEGQRDDDMDGVLGVSDSCPGTPQGTIVDATGCVSVAQTEENETGENGTNNIDEESGFTLVIWPASGTLDSALVAVGIGLLLSGVYLFASFKILAIINTAFPDRKKRKMLGCVLGEKDSGPPQISEEPKAESDRPDSTMPTQIRIATLSSTERRVGVIRQGAQRDINHHLQALHNQYGQPWEWTELVSFLKPHHFECIPGHRVAKAHMTKGRRLLVFMDPNTYFTFKDNDLQDGDAKAPGNVFVDSSVKGLQQFLYGRADGKILFHTFQTNDESVVKLACESMISEAFRFTQSGEAIGSKFGMPTREQGPIDDHNPRPFELEDGTPVPPSKLTWLSMQIPPDTSWVPEPNHLGWLIARKGGDIEKAWKYLVESPDYQALRKEFHKFLLDKQQGHKVHRIYAKTMHGDCRAGNWIWRPRHYEGRNSGKNRYHPIDLANYNARSSDDRAIHRKGEVMVKGETVEWIRPFVFGHHRRGVFESVQGPPAGIPALPTVVWSKNDDPSPYSMSPDEYPDPLFDLAELIASLLLDIWIEPDDIIIKHLKVEDIDVKSGEYLLCDIWDSETREIQGQQCYIEIFRSLEPVMKWIDRIDDKKSNIVGGAEPTKKWFRYAIADRLIYRALLISSNSGCFEIGSRGQITTPEIALRIARCIIDETTPPTPAEASAADLRQARAKHIMMGGSDPPRIDARGNKGTQVNTIVGRDIKGNINKIAEAIDSHYHPQPPEGSSEADSEEHIPELEYHLNDETANPEEFKVGDSVWFKEEGVHFHGEIMSIDESKKYAELLAQDEEIEAGADGELDHADSKKMRVRMTRLRPKWNPSS